MDTIIKATGYVIADTQGQNLWQIHSVPAFHLHGQDSMRVQLYSTIEGTGVQGQFLGWYVCITTPYKYPNHKRT